jgi:MscS family membrane protein
LFAAKPPAAPSLSGYANGEISSIGVDFAKLVMTALEKSSNPTIILIFQYWKNTIPPVIRSLFSSVFLGDLLMFAMFQLTYKKSMRWAHKLQIVGWRLLSMGEVLNFHKSILGFLEERAGLLSKLMGCNYAIKLICLILTKLGFHIRSDLPILISKVLYAMYITHFIDLFKSRFMNVFLPSLTENRRQAYVFTRSSSVVVWSVGILVACEMVSTYLRVPLTSTLAFGGVGGLVLGFSARDIAANFLGGMLLLFNEPFTPGDMVTFRTGNTELIGRVERVGWGQTRIRGRDTRPTYIPNSHFVQTAVTNMERITHRKFETIFPIRHQDAASMMEVLSRIKDGIRTVPKLDTLSMPFRVSFVKVGSYGLEIEVVCYFATKSIDEFLALQQLTNLEILKAISTSGAKLALPTSQIYHNALSTPDAPVQVQQIQQVPGVGPVASLLTGEVSTSIQQQQQQQQSQKEKLQQQQQQASTDAAVQKPAPSTAGSTASRVSSVDKKTLGAPAVQSDGSTSMRSAPAVAGPGAGTATGTAAGVAAGMSAAVRAGSGAVAVVMGVTGADAVVANDPSQRRFPPSVPMPQQASSSSASPLLSTVSQSATPPRPRPEPLVNSVGAKARPLPSIVLDGHVAGDVYDSSDFVGTTGSFSSSPSSPSLLPRKSTTTNSNSATVAAVAERPVSSMPSGSSYPSAMASKSGGALMEQTASFVSVSPTVAVRAAAPAPSVSGSARGDHRGSLRGSLKDHPVATATAPAPAIPLEWDLDAAFRGTAVLGNVMTPLAAAGGSAGAGGAEKGSWTFGRDAPTSATARRVNEGNDTAAIINRKTTINTINTNTMAVAAAAATGTNNSNSSRKAQGPAGESVERSSSSPPLSSSPSPSSSPSSPSPSSSMKFTFPSVRRASDSAAAASTMSGASASYDAEGYSIDDVDDPAVEVDSRFYHEHSIDDVDDVDDKWIEVDTTFGEW